MVLDSDLALDFHPLAGIAGAVERLDGTRADQKLRILLARCVRDEALDAAQWKTVGLRYRLVIWVGKREIVVSILIHCFGLGELYERFAARLRHSPM